MQVVLALMLTASAWAEAPTKKTVKLVTGKEVQAEIFAAPEAGTLEGDLLAAMTAIKSGAFDDFIGKHCSKTLCPDDAKALEELKRFNLTAWNKTIKGCFHEESGLMITKRQGDPAKDEKVTLYVWCGDKRLPATATLHKADGWKLNSASF